MTAPPGPAMIEWDSVHGQDDTPERLEHLPEWAEPGAMDTPTARAKKQVGRRFRKALGYNPTDPKAKREAAIARWRKLIPEGKVPAPPRPDGKKE